MCGITGYHGHFPPQNLIQANNLQSHRGPDDSGTYFDHAQNIGLAHTRLSILDLSPPLISDQTPWRDFEEKGVGWVLSLDDMGAFVRTIDQFVRIDCKSRCAMRERARQYAVEVNQNSAVLQANKDLFLTALG